MLVISAQSTQYILVAVTAVADPTETDGVEFAFLGPYATAGLANVAVVTPSTTFYTGFWGETTYNPTLYNALCLIGPDGGITALTSGVYCVYTKITGDPEGETPILYSGPFAVT